MELKVYYSVHKSPSLDQLNVIHSLKPYLRSILVLSSDLCLTQKWLFPIGFVAKM
jgi:hypothetical protein